MNRIALFNGDIWSMASPLERNEALLIEGGLIKKIGRNDEILKLCAEDMGARMIDLDDKTVLPGFIDSHIHFESNALAMIQVDLKYPKVETIKDIQNELRKSVKTSGNLLPGEKMEDAWIVGNLYDHNKLVEKKHPDKSDLDAVSLEQPILIFHISGHMVAVNSKALEAAGITRETIDPAGGKIERDSEGEATGVLYETAFNLAINKIPQYSRAEKIKSIEKSVEMNLEKGITSVHDMGVEDYTVDMEMYFQMLGNFQFKTRVSILYPYDSPEKAEADLSNEDSYFNKYFKMNNDFIKLSGLKCFSDGSMIGRTAAVKKPYRDKPGNGMMLLTNEQLTKMARLAYENQMQLGIHAIGDRAIESCLDAYEKILLKDGEYEGDNRFRIEHCGIGSDEAFERMRKINVLIASQPKFIQDFGDGILLNYDKDVIDNIYEFNTMLKHDLHLSFGSDGPVTWPDPISAIRCAVDRKTEEGKDFVQEENISLYDAVKCHTYEGAYASFEEDRKGMLREGFFADMVILSDKLSIGTLSKIKVEKTILDGRIVFEN